MKLYLNKRLDFIDIEICDRDVSSVKKLFIEGTAVRKFCVNNNVIIHNYTETALKQTVKDYGKIIININGNNIICDCKYITKQLNSIYNTVV